MEPITIPHSGRTERDLSVVLVIGSLQAGGAERVMADMANYWCGKNWSVTLATWGGPEIPDFYELLPGVHRIWLNVYSPNTSFIQKLRSNISRIRKFRSLILRMQPNVVVSFIDTSNMLTLISTAGLGFRVVVSERIHAAYHFGISRLWRALRVILYRHADAVVAQTHDAAGWLEQKCKAKVCVIPNPLRPLPMITREREPFVLAVGRLNKQKGFDLLLRAFASIQSGFTSWRLVILGAGPELKALTKLRDALSLAGRVDFVPPEKDVESWMARAGIVVVPSRYEGFPNVLLESMGMGAAVIATDCPSGPAEIVQDGINGRLVPIENVDALARVMVELMSQPGIRRSLGQEATKVRERFQQDKIMKQWEQCLMGPS